MNRTFKPAAIALNWAIAVCVAALAAPCGAAEDRTIVPPPHAALAGDQHLTLRLVDGLPAGSARTCNRQHAGQRIPTPQQWADQILKRGGALEVLYIEDMAHSAFWGPLSQRRATWGNGQTLGASLGATPAARERFFKAMLDFIARTDR